MIDSRSLTQEIHRILERIERVNDRSSRLTEADTKAAFIEPVLNALGWDLRDVFAVSREYRHRPQDNPVDYALFVVGSPVLFVEAKSLHQNMSDYRWITQTIAYANAAGVEWCVLTNGDEYRIYNAFAKAEAEKKIFRQFRLSDRDSLELSVETLLLLSAGRMAEKRIDVVWKTQFVDRQVRETVTTLFAQPNDSLIRLIARNAPELRPAEIRASLHRADIEFRLPPPNSARDTEPEVVAPIVNDTASLAPPLVAKSAPRANNRVRIIDLIQAGLIKTPQEIEVTFKGERLTATIHSSGSIEFHGQVYPSPSQAGGVAKNAVSGPPADGRAYWATNGWTFWHYRDPVDGNLKPIEHWLNSYSDSQQ